MTYKRLDVYMCETGLAESRNKARELILSGSVKLGDNIAAKPSQIVDANTPVEIIRAEKYVGRAGYKLETAVEAFGLCFTGLVCLDAGAAAGGFTDVLLRSGAKKVYAVDVGENQLHPRLRNDSRVISMEKTDVRTLELPEKVDFITADLSFISLRLIIPSLGRHLKDGGGLTALIKPQFEAGKKHFKNGVIKDEKLIKEITGSLLDFIVTNGFEIIGTIPSKLNEKGKNKEELCYALKIMQK